MSKVSPMVLLVGRAAAEEHWPKDHKRLFCVCGELWTSVHVADEVTSAVVSTLLAEAGTDAVKPS